MIYIFKKFILIIFKILIININFNNINYILKLILIFNFIIYDF